MDELIKIEEREGIATCNARDLHEFLEVKSRFNDWITGRIKKYDFVEGEDFTAITESKVTAQGNASEYMAYYISTDMAKELSMVENNDKGKQARKYFISIEKASKALALRFNDPAEAARAWQMSMKLNRRQSKKLKNRGSWLRKQTTD